MHTIIHKFKTRAEAYAFLEGVEFVNDSSIEVSSDDSTPLLVTTVDEDRDDGDTEARNHF